MKKRLNRFEKWWDNGMFALRDNANRYDSLLFAGVFLYINLMLGVLIDNSLYYPTLFFGICFLLMDNHNLNDTKAQQEVKTKEVGEE